MADKYTPKHFNVSFPREFVAHLETNRPDKLNAYFEPYALHPLRFMTSS